MADVLQVAERLSRTNVEQVLITILKQPSTEKFIINLNTRVQLYKDNEDSLGVKLYKVGGEYQNSTVKRGNKKGKQKIDLYDTGAFYGSFSVSPTADADFVIDSDPMKGKFNLFDRWGENVEGLTDENLKLVLDYLEDKFWKVIFRGL